MKSIFILSFLQGLILGLMSIITKTYARLL